MGRTLDEFVNSLFSPAAKGFGQACWRPPVDIYRTAHGWIVKYELAGIRPEEVELERRGRRLLLRGVRRDMRLDEHQRSYSLEISYNRFERIVELPCELEPMDLSTDYRDGMLVVWLAAKASSHEPW